MPPLHKAAPDNRRIDECAVPAQATGHAGGARLQGHLLVAEDNPICAKVNQALLCEQGLTLTLVGDGQQAVEAILHGRPDLGPDLILMDLQMPLLDGYAATRRIRQWETETGRQRRLPIVALTAHAFEQDRQRCLDAGMDDFLSKPVLLPVLQAALARWLPGASQTR